MEVPMQKDNLTTAPLREVWEHLVSRQVTRDLDGWLSCFAPDGVLEWPFRLKGVPPRLEGQAAIRAALAPVWERARTAKRRITGHDRVVFHETTDPEVLIVEFEIVGETARGPFRQAAVYLLRVREGRVVLLREFMDTAAINELFQVG
jgi:ketosteroid isomerase-like protein